MGFFDKIFGTHSQRELKKMRSTVDKVLAFEADFRKLSEQELKGKTIELKEKLANGTSLDDLLPEAFAAIREAADRVLGLRPYEVQIIGGIVIHQGRIAEMKTGEGKTLMAILPAYLNALSGDGVHVVTVNEYLARRDSEWMGKVYRYMGLTVGLVAHGMSPKQRQEAYLSDITYCTNNELGFDYLRDNMAIHKTAQVQRGHNFAIVDEVDSILIDEARTPLIISGQGDASSKLYELADMLVSRMKRQVFTKTDSKESQDDLDCDYVVDEKGNTVTLTAKGIAKAESFFSIENLGDPENATIAHHVNQAMRARGIMQKDVDYVIKDGEIIIVDEHTGRLMFGRRYNEGLHQAIEAKEKVTVAHESKTLATITFQNFFRSYTKLSGMTGTALTEEEEFGSIYTLDIVEIPTNLPIARKDNADVVYQTESGKMNAALAQIQACHQSGQPIVVGTVSIEKSEEISALLKRNGIPHTVLNAKVHEKEAEIVAQAGKLGAVTIATNMAGRGTDIVLGGNAEFMAKADLRKQGFEEHLIAESNSFAETDDAEILKARQAYNEAYAIHKQEVSAEAEKVRAAGGLYILGTERHESRRIDNQLRGRAGRQGDPGVTQFLLSLEDDIMRVFGGDRMEKISAMMDKMNLDDDTPIDAKILSGAIENAQKAVESRHFQSRKHVLEYDDVMNTQRSVMYEQRGMVLEGQDLTPTIQTMIRFMVESHVHDILAETGYLADREQLNRLLKRFIPLYFLPGAYNLTDDELSAVDKDKLVEDLYAACMNTYAQREVEFTPEKLREIERVVFLKVVDTHWMDQIDSMTELRQGIVLRAYGQMDPVVAYKKEGFEMFDAMIAAVRMEIVRILFSFRMRPNEPIKREPVAKITFEGGGGDKTVKKQPVKTVKIGRNDPCPCGSGKKYKQCCLDKDKAL
ncbi:MAG: preprotein translocase subunit SecA [Eubacteriales bacterium]